MMCRLSFILVFVFAIYSLIGQKENYTWVLGYDSDSIAGIEGSIISFSDNIRTIKYQPIALNIASNVASVSDENGELLFYTNGCSVANKYHEILENGTGLNPGELAFENCDSRGYVGVQNIIILQDNYNPGGYYILHKPVEWEINPVIDLKIFHLLYSYVNMNLNNGKGKVTLKNEIIHNSLIEYSHLHAITHKNNKDWWFLQIQDETNLYFKYKISEFGPSLVDSFRIGEPITRFASGGGQAKFSPDGSKWAFYNKGDQLKIFDFNLETGDLSNYTKIDVPGDGLASGLEFSPNSRFIYISTIDSLFQYDLNEIDTNNALLFIAENDGFGDPFYNGFVLQQRGPDCKIYISSGNGTQHFHVIRKPNEKGKNCDFRQRFLKLPTYKSSFSIPNFPIFRIGDEEVCDSTITSIFGQDIYFRSDLKAFPNPTSDIIQIEIPEAKSGIINIYNYNGEQIHSIDVQPGTINQQINLSQYPDGYYLIEFYPEDNVGRKVYTARVSLVKI